jgi:hypothetical protein
MQLAKLSKKVLLDRGTEAVRALFGDIERVKVDNHSTYRIVHRGKLTTIVVKTGFRYISELRSPDDSYWVSLRDTDHVLFCTEGDPNGKTVRRYLFPTEAVQWAFDKQRARCIAEGRWKHKNRTYLDPTKTGDDNVEALLDAATWSDVVAAQPLSDQEVSPGA